MEEVHLKVRDKRKVYLEILKRRGLSDDEVCFIGDDVVDLGVLTLVGLGVAPSDAHPMVRNTATWVTSARGGKGAVREVADFILTAQGKLGSLLEALRGHQP